MIESRVKWRRMSWIGMVCLAVATAGCASSNSPVEQGGQPDQTNQSPSTTNSPEPGQDSNADADGSAAGEDTLRTITDGLGNEVAVPAEPQRVIATYLEDHLVALDVTPVAQWSIKEGSVQQYLQEWLKDVPTIPFDLPYEAVMSFAPDLLLIDSAEMVAGDKYNQYSKIAPTFAVGGEENNDWREELLIVGKALNKEERARQVLEEYEAYAEESREKLQASVGDQSAAALWVTAKSVFIVSEQLSSGDVLYRDLGLRVPGVVQEVSQSGSANWNQLSMEKLVELDADHIFIINSTGVSMEELLADPVWQTVSAVKQGQVYEYTQQGSWLYTGTIANRLIIQDVLDSLIP